MGVIQLITNKGKFLHHSFTIQVGHKMKKTEQWKANPSP